MTHAPHPRTSRHHPQRRRRGIRQRLTPLSRGEREPRFSLDATLFFLLVTPDGPRLFFDVIPDGPQLFPDVIPDGAQRRAGIQTGAGNRRVLRTMSALRKNIVSLFVPQGANYILPLVTIPFTRMLSVAC